MFEPGSRYRSAIRPGPHGPLLKQIGEGPSVSGQTEARRPTKALVRSLERWHDLHRREWRRDRADGRVAEADPISP